MSGWHVVHEDRRQHVIPTDDLRPHGACDCWCRPQPEIDAPSVWVHYSMDRREEFERSGAPAALVMR